MSRFLHMMAVWAVLAVVLTSPYIASAQQFDRTNLVPVTPENITNIRALARLGHGTADQVAWHPSGEVVAFGGGWGVWILDEAYEEVAHYPNIPQTEDIAWSASGDRLATLHETEIRLWRVSDDFLTVTAEGRIAVDPAEFDPIYRIPNPRCVAWSADGRFIGLGTQHNSVGEISQNQSPEPATIVIYDSKTGQQIADSISDDLLEKRLIARCRGGAMRPDGEISTWVAFDYLAGSTFSRLNFLEDGATEPVAYTTFATLFVFGMDWHPDDDYLTVLYEDSIVTVQYPEPQHNYGLPFFNGYIDFASWSPDGNHLMTYSTYTPQANIWTLEANEIQQTQISTYHARSDIGSVLWSANSQEIQTFTSEYDYYETQFIDITTRETVRRVSVGYDAFSYPLVHCWNDAFTRYAIYEPETEILFVATFASEPVTVSWNSDARRFVEGPITQGDPLPEVQIPGSFSNLYDCSWQDEQLIVRLGEDSSSLTDYIVNETTGELTPVDSTADSIDTVIWQRNAGEGELPPRTYTLWLNNPNTGEELSENSDLPLPDAPIQEGGRDVVIVAVSPDQRLVAVSVAGGINFWNLEDGTLLHFVQTDTDIGAMDWDVDGKILAAGSMDGTTYLFGISG